MRCHLNNRCGGRVGDAEARRVRWGIWGVRCSGGRAGGTVGHPMGLHDVVVMPSENAKRTKAPNSILCNVNVNPMDTNAMVEKANSGTKDEKRLSHISEHISSAPAVNGNAFKKPRVKFRT